MASLPAVRAEPPAKTDALGDPLPAGATARLGTIRFRGEGKFYKAVVAPDGKTLALTDGPRFRILDIATGKELRADKPTQFDFYAYSPDGELFGAGDNVGCIRFWDADGKPAGEIAPLATTESSELQNQSAFAFSRDHKYVVTGTKVWKGAPKLQAVVFEVATGKPVGRVKVEHNMAVHGALSDDGKVLATGGDDTTVLLWDLTAEAGTPKP
jgi:WD40 repeat protein